VKLDKFDREILRVMQRDATVSMAELSQYVGLSHTLAGAESKRMEADGVIRQKVTLLDSKETKPWCVGFHLRYTKKTMMVIHLSILKKPYKIL